MPILGIDSTRKDYKLLGVHLPLGVYKYLTLFTLARGISKSNLFKVLIEDWMKEQKSEGTDNELIQELVIRINNEWQERKKAHPRANFSDFKNKLRTELLGKGLERKQVVSILSQIKANGKN